MSQLQQLVNSTFVSNTKTPTVIAWIKDMTTGNQETFGSIKFHHERILDANQDIRDSAVDCQGVFRGNVLMNVLFLNHRALNIFGGIVHWRCGSGIMGAQNRTIQVPKSGFPRRPKIITGLSGIEWARGRIRTTCADCQHNSKAASRYNLSRCEADLFFEIIVDEAIHEAHPKYHIFPWNIHHSLSISKLEFSWVAVVDGNNFKQRPVDEGYGPEKRPAQGRRRKPVKPALEKAQLSNKKRKGYAGESHALHDVEIELENDEFELPAVGEPLVRLEETNENEVPAFGESSPDSNGTDDEMDIDMGSNRDIDMESNRDVEMED